MTASLDSPAASTPLASAGAPTPASAQRGPYAKTAEFRAAALDAALRIMAADGTDQATLSRIADELGRSKAGLLHHFGSRDALLLEVVRHRDAVNRAQFPPSDEPGLSSSVDLVAHNATVPGLVALFTVQAALAAADTADTDRRRHFRERYRRTRRGLAGRIRAAQTAGLFRDDLDPEVVSTIVVATMDGLQLQWLIDPGIDMAAHLRALVDMLGTRP